LPAPARSTGARARDPDGGALVGVLADLVGAHRPRTAHVFQTVNPNLLPDPLAVVRRGGTGPWARGTLQRDIIASLLRVLQGFPDRRRVGRDRRDRRRAGLSLLRDILEPIIDLLRPIPPLAFLPLLVLYLGIGNTSKIAFIAYSAFFPIFTTTREGMKYVDPLLVRAAESLGASRRQILWHVVHPVPPSRGILTGLRLGPEPVVLRHHRGRVYRRERGAWLPQSTTPASFSAWTGCCSGASIIGLLGYGFNQVFGRLEWRLLRWKSVRRGHGPTPTTSLTQRSFITPGTTRLRHDCGSSPATP